MGNEAMERVAELTRDERSVLLYAESCMVDQGGLLEGARMNASDFEALNKFQAEGLLIWGRIPGAMLGKHGFSKSSPTHWVRFATEAWALAAELRQRRSLQVGPYARSVFEAVTARATGAP